MISLEQAEALAPDSGTLKRARKLAQARNFREIGSDGNALWAVVIGSKPYETCIDLQGPAYRCSCPVSRQPCKHALALLLLVAQEPDRVLSSPPPNAHLDWLQRRAAVARKRRRTASEKPEVRDPGAQARRAREREEKVARGLRELRCFLEDTVRLGLADTAKRTQDVWDRMERRLIDAQARGLANGLGWIRRQIGRGEDWTERVVFALARLHLLVSAYERREQLDPALVEEIRVLIGWNRRRDAILATPPIRSDWLVLNRATRYESGLYTQTVWLFDPDSRRFAQVLNFATDFNPDALPVGEQPGTLIRADVHFHSSYLPLRATLVRSQLFTHRIPTDFDALADRADPDLETAVRRFQEHRLRFPFLLEWPLVVRGLRPVLQGGRLALADRRDSVVPLDPEPGEPWEFLLYSGPEPHTVFFTYTGSSARPWGLLRGDRWIPLNLDAMDPDD